MAAMYCKLLLCAGLLMLASCALPPNPGDPGTVTVTCHHCNPTINGANTAVLKVVYSPGTIVVVSVTDSALVQVFSRNSIRLYDTVVYSQSTIKYKF